MTTPGQQIEVDLLSLQQTKDGILTNTNAGLPAGIADAKSRIFRGLPVGERSESGEVDGSRQAMAFAMQCFWKNGEAYVERAKQLTEFLGKVREEYRTADDFAKLNVDAVTARLKEAVQAAPQPPPVRGEFA
jgi:hypothetical protein